MEKSRRKYATKASLGPPFKNKVFWKRIIKKPEKVKFIFSFEPIPL